MKKFLLGSALVLLSTAAALATDLPAKAPNIYKAAPGITAVDWTGWYVGGHIGYGWGEYRGTFRDIVDEGALDMVGGGLLGGGQLGYLWQTGRSVYGVEVDGSWGNLSKSRTDAVATEKFKTDFIGSARFISGITVDNLLLFSSIGIAYQQTDFTVNLPAAASQSLNSVGIASGFGLEWALAPNWSARAEYLYYSFDKRKDIAGLTGASSTYDFVKIDNVQAIRFGVNYRPGMSIKQTAAAPAGNWSGGYIGAHAGYGGSSIIGAYDEEGDSGSFHIDPKGFLGGGQMGWNWQNRAWVYGVELDGTWSGMDKDRIDREGDKEKLKTSALASLRARIGLSAGNQLFYVTGGIGYVQSSLTVTGSDTPSPAKATLASWGPVIGSGAEWMFAQNWTARIEGLTYLVDRKKAITTLTDDSDSEDFIHQRSVTVIRAGLNYRY